MRNQVPHTNHSPWQHWSQETKDILSWELPTDESAFFLVAFNNCLYIEGTYRYDTDAEGNAWRELDPTPGTSSIINPTPRPPPPPNTLLPNPEVPKATKLKIAQASRTSTTVTTPGKAALAAMKAHPAKVDAVGKRLGPWDP